jgi:DNA-binding response OmpR family regulator
MANPEKSNPDPSRPTLRLLIVEDNPVDAELEIETLKIAGYSLFFDVVDSAENFRQQLQQTNYDIIICDHAIGDWKGLDALKILQQSRKNIPILIVTAALGEEAAVEYLKLGAADYVLKDRLQRLPSAVGRALNDKTLREEAARAEEALRKSEASLSLAQSIGHLGSWEQDLATGDLVWSAETFRIFGLDPAHTHPNEQLFLDSVYPRRSRVRERQLRHSSIGQQIV